MDDFAVGGIRNGLFGSESRRHSSPCLGAAAPLNWRRGVQICVSPCSRVTSSASSTMFLMEIGDVVNFAARSASAVAAQREKAERAAVTAYRHVLNCRRLWAHRHPDASAGLHAHRRIRGDQNDPNDH